MKWGAGRCVSKSNVEAGRKGISMTRLIRFETVHVASSLVIRAKIYLITRQKSTIEIKIEEYQIVPKIYSKITFQ
jgi:hypothetical protein